MRAKDEREDILGRRSTAGIAGHSARGIVWTLVGQWGGTVLRLASLPFLARLLQPSDFGLVDGVVAVTGFVTVVGSLGLSEAIVQREKVTQAQASALFWLNVLLGAVLTAAVAASAPLLAAFYGEPEVLWITVALSGSFLLSGLVVQHQAMALRRLDFRAVALRTFVSTAAGVVVSIVMALMGAGYWALVGQNLAIALATAVVMWTAVPWRPSRPARAPGVRALLSYGGGISTFRVLDYVSRNADNVLIGRFLGAEQLGLYSRAYTLLSGPLNQVHGPVANVVRPSMSALWPEPERYRRYYLGAVAGLCYLVAPVVCVLAVLSGPFIAVVLGPDYAPAADVFRWLAVAGLVQTVGYTNGWLFASSGRSWAMARWALVSRPIVVASFLVGLPFGIEGVAIAYAATQVVLVPVGIAQASRTTPVRVRDVMVTVVRPLLMALLAGGVALGASWLLADTPALLRLLVGGGLAVLMLVGVGLAWPSVRREALGFLTSFRGAKRGGATDAESVPAPRTSVQP